MRSFMETVCESAKVAKILWWSLSEDDQLVSKMVVEGILRIKRLVECAYEGGMHFHDHDKEEIKKVCYTIVGAMFEMEGQSQSQSQLISILEENIDEVILKMVSENITNININIVEGGDVDVLGRVKKVMLLSSGLQRVVVCIVGEGEGGGGKSLTALARELYEDNGFKGRMDHDDFGWVSMSQVRMQPAPAPLGINNHTMYNPLPDDNDNNNDNNVNPEMSMLKEFEYMLVIDGVNGEAEWEWVDTTARSNWLLITTCSKQVATIIASRYLIVYNIPPEDHLPPNTDSKKDVGSGPSTHFLKKMFSIKGKGKGKGKTPLNTITKSFITDIGMRGYYVIEHKRCPICLDNPKDMAFGCGHLTCCDCGKRLQLCPICRSGIEIRLKIYYN